jgi:tetratricopeptide (TPR) repeat protein
MLEEVQQTMIRNQRNVWYAQSEYIIGKVKSQIATGPKPAISMMAKNLGFLLKNVPFAGKKADEHFKKAVDLLRQIGAKGLLGPVYLDYGLLHKDIKKTNQAKEDISEAINIFQGCEAEVYLKQANEILESMQ